MCLLICIVEQRGKKIKFMIFTRYTHYCLSLLVYFVCIVPIILSLVEYVRKKSLNFLLAQN